MSTQMPSLFDDLEFFGPAPKKEAKNKKNQEIAAPKAAPEEELPEPEIENSNVIQVEEAQELKDMPALTEDNVNTIPEQETADLVQEKESETTPNQPDLEATDLASNRISFEFPEEESEPSEVAPESSLSASKAIPGIKDEAVDDLDQLITSELILQDYTGYAGYHIEEEQKKNIEDLDVSNAETIENAKKELPKIEAETLDFEFEKEPSTKSAPLPEFNLQNKYYTIGEVADMFGVNVSHIRFWTTEFKLKVRTTRKGDRLYHPENIARLRLIHHLVKENGHTIKGAKEKLKTQKTTVNTQIDLKDKLTDLKYKLERIRRNL